MVQHVRAKAQQNSVPLLIDADVRENTLSAGTVSHFILPTQEKPDICLVQKDNNSCDITLVELSVDLEPNIDKARQCKEHRCAWVKCETLLFSQ